MPPFGLRCDSPRLVEALSLDPVVFVGFSVDGGHLDFADLERPPASLDDCIVRARGERYPTWEAFRAREQAAIGRWSADLEAAHRMTMREDGRGGLEPIASRETRGRIDWGNVVEPTATTFSALARVSAAPRELAIAIGDCLAA